MLINLTYQDTCAIADTMGGELISYMDGEGTEYLWNGDAAYWSGRSPHLFPIIGTLKNGRIRIKEQEYSMPKHGFARNSEFNVHEVSENSVTFILSDNAETYQVYPFHFSFYVTHTLEQSGFTTSYRIANQDREEMFFNIGGHVGVKCPIHTSETFEDYKLVFDQPLAAGAYVPSSDDPIPSGGYSNLLDYEDTLSLSYDLFEKGPIIIDQIASHTLRLMNQQNGKGIYFEYDGFPVLALWTFGSKKAPYLCLEPWHGLPAMEQDGIDFAEKPYVIRLQPGGTKQLQYKMKLL